jgi:hypothetical protein
MSKFITLALAASACALAAPASAQTWNNGSGEVSISTRIAQLDSRLQAGIQSGEISRYEARSLRQQLRDLRRLNSQYSYNGLTRVERDDLRNRIRLTRQQIRTADNGRYDRDMRYGSWNDRYWNQNGYYGQGGPLEDVQCDRRDGIGGVLDSVLGRSNCFEVGDRVSGNLYAVPTHLRSRYRDSNYSYFRSDGRLIYEVDARTNTVVRIYGMD